VRRSYSFTHAQVVTLQQTDFPFRFEHLGDELDDLWQREDSFVFGVDDPEADHGFVSDGAVDQDVEEQDVLFE